MSFFKGIQENKIEKGKKNVNYITTQKIRAFSVIAGTIGILLLSGCQSQTSSGQAIPTIYKATVLSGIIVKYDKFTLHIEKSERV